jgi:hypothetical protein
LTLADRYERRAAKRYQRMLERGRRDPELLAFRARVEACKPHPNRRPNPEATAIRPPNVAEICDDCGLSIVTVKVDR